MSTCDGEATREGGSVSVDLLLHERDDARAEGAHTSEELVAGVGWRNALVGDSDEGEHEERARFARSFESRSLSTARARFGGGRTKEDQRQWKKGNRDDNFFGPVSTSFIRSVSLSETEMSDGNNHDITLDSTAFSLHFRNIAPADDRTTNSVGSTRTPTNAAVSDGTDSVIVPKKPFVCNKLSPADLGGNADDSSTMSLIEEKSRKYDYGKLSPTLEKLLNEVDRSMQSNSPDAVNIGYHSKGIIKARQSVKHETHASKVAVINTNGEYPFDSHLLESFVEDSSKFIIYEDSPNKGLLLETPIIKNAEGAIAAIGKDNHDDPYAATVSDLLVTAQKTGLLSPLNIESRTKTSLQLDQLSGNKYPSVKTPHSEVPTSVVEGDHDKNVVCEAGISTPETAHKLIQAPFPGSVSSLRAKRQQLFFDASVSLKSTPISSRAKEQAPSSLNWELTRHGERISAIKNHMSQLKITQTPDLNNPKSPMVHVPLDLHDKLEYEADIPDSNFMDSSVNNFEENIHSVEKNRGQTQIVEPENLRHARPDIVTESAQTEAETGMMPSPLMSINLAQSLFDPKTHALQSEQIVEVKASRSHNLCEVNDLDHCFVQEQVVMMENDLIGKKRRLERNLVTSETHIDKISRLEKSPESSSELVTNKPATHQGHHSKLTNTCLLNLCQPTKHWSDLLSSFHEGSKVAFSPSVHKLSWQELNMLEDLLDEVQMARKYLRISTSLRNNNDLGDLHKQRVNEALGLQDKYLLEQSKLQIKHAKLDQLHNRTQATKSGLCDCRDLKAAFSQLCLHRTRAVQSSDSFISSYQNQEDHKNVASMRLHQKMLEDKVDHLLKSLTVCCRVKGNMNIAEIIKVANEHLERKRCVNIIHQRLRVWELSNIVKKDNECDIILNYCNLLFQSFTPNPRQVSSTVVTNSLNEVNIAKTFQNMNAYVAFDFAFDNKDGGRITSLNCCQQKEMETSLLLGTVLDVLDEVKAASLEILNLTSSTFNKSPRGQLELQLCFINFKCGWKLILSVDLSDLKRAVYPSQPSELRYKICETQTIPSPLKDTIMDTLKNMQGGHPSILRLCRSISQLVQDSTS
ncbi:uncharacterized protein LOC141818186 [Curcuma longa]|uniref:uncharacterized protein LOC141818186 n=1 Tax=Curcuma longa TaxID=136217 RepID=UPI003D9E6DCA